LRTHIALIECAAELLKEGKTFTVADVADKARVGRTTAYRYFPSVEQLVVHASLHAITEVEKKNIGLELESATSPYERLRRVIEASDKSIKDHEHVYRTMLRESLNGEDSDLPRRSGARKGILDAAIGSLKRELGDKRYQRLTAALSLFIGVEAAVVMRDVVKISDEDAREIKVWGANVILQAMLLEASHPVSSARSSKPETHMGKARRKRVA
jgi:AcrR family transcriptional regulator